MKQRPCFMKNLRTRYCSLADILLFHCAHTFINKQKLQTNDGFLYKTCFLPYLKAKLMQASQKLPKEKKINWQQVEIRRKLMLFPEGAKPTDSSCSPSARNEASQHSQKRTVGITNTDDIMNLAKSGNQKTFTDFPGKEFH